MAAKKATKRLKKSKKVERTRTLDNIIHKHIS